MSQMILNTFIETIESDKKLVAKEPKLSGSMVEIIMVIQSSQSLNIRLGNTIECCFNNYIRRKGAEIVSSKMFKDKQADLYFSYNGKTYYFESKNNVNLDTEKSLATANKIAEMSKKVDTSGCVSFRASSKQELCKWAKNELKPYLFGYNDFFAIFEDSLEKDEYEKILEIIRKIYPKAQS